ncbi:MAG: hypothetical protein SGPRY_007830 [Prymnesium sp.]
MDDDDDDEPCDEVTKEVREWLDLSKSKVKPFINEKGLLEEFAFIASVRKEFKLHFLWFIEVMAHFPIEANSEDTFCLSEKLCNPNSETGSDILGTLVRIHANKKIYSPPIKDIQIAYAKKRGTAALEDDDDALEKDADPEDAGSDESEINEP